MPVCKANGVGIYYEFSGLDHGPVLVFSNSLGTALEMWDPQARHFADKFRVLRYDSRGHGRTEVSPGPYTIETLARDVLTLASSLGIERMTFCGLSMGGMVGQWLGSHASWRIDRLVLCHTAAKIGSEDIWNRRIAAVRAHGMTAVAEGVLERWFTPTFRLVAPESVKGLEAMLLACPAEGYAASCAAIRDMDQHSSAASIDVPVQVIFGENDAVTTAEDAGFLVSQIPHASTVSLPAAHMSNIEASAQFNQAVEHFLME